MQRETMNSARLSRLASFLTACLIAFAVSSCAQLSPFGTPKRVSVIKNYKCKPPKGLIGPVEIAKVAKKLTGNDLVEGYAVQQKQLRKLKVDHEAFSRQQKQAGCK